MRFAESETTWDYLLLMREVALSAGLPLALYSDRHDIFHARREPTLAEQLSNRRPLTQFGRALEELGVHISKAYSPQAKGRIERLWGVPQDRLVVELRPAKRRRRAKRRLSLLQRNDFLLPTLQAVALCGSTFIRRRKPSRPLSSRLTICASARGVVVASGMKR